MASTTDTHIRLAEEIAKRLPEVSRNEWMRWLQIVKRYGLKRGLLYAEKWSRDITLRPNVKKAYQQVAQAVKANEGLLQGLEREELQTVFGYVGWHLRIADKKRQEQEVGRKRKGRRR